MQFLTLFLSIFILFPLISSDAVCDENTLITELRQDIADNHQLDCLRYIRDPPTDHQESPEEKKNRVAAVWDSDCSFEADYDWASRLKDIYGLDNGLVDVTGDSVKEDFEDQADMCEIVRALIAGGKIPTAKPDVKNVEEEALDSIDCPGDGESGLKLIGIFRFLWVLMGIIYGDFNRIIFFLLMGVDIWSF